MRRRLRQGADDADVDMTPMLDIVFILLIFFIVTATFFDMDGIDLTQPPAPPPNPNQDKSKPAIAVFVNGRNLCFVDGTRTECGRVLLSVESILADKAGASIILKIDEAADAQYLVGLKDKFNAKGLDSSVEIIRGQ